MILKAKLGSGSSRLRECLGSCGDWLVRYWRSDSDSSSETETDIMEIDSPPDFSPPKPRDRIVRVRFSFQFLRFLTFFFWSNQLIRDIVIESYIRK